MNEFGADSGGRMKGVTIVKPIVYGNIARYFGRKREEDGHTHQWTVFLRPYENEDISQYIKKVNFKLHESYANQNRSVLKPPYEVTETGWGEFEVIIKIYFYDPNERPVTVYHLLKLFQSETDIILGKKSLIAEYYDEIVLQDPTVMMHKLLTNIRPHTLGTHKHETDMEEKKVKTLNMVLAAKTKIRNEVSELNERLKRSKESIHKMKSELGDLNKTGVRKMLKADIDDIT